jgi:hypothetical protein
MSLKAFHIVFIIFSTLLAIGTGAWCVWVDLIEGAPIYLAGAIASFAAAVALIIYGIWFYKKMKRLRITHMKKFLSILSLSLLVSAHEALACPFCYGAKDGKSTEHMAIAIWFLFGAVMSVIGGIGAFTFHLWRHGRMPTEPYQELTEEDLSKYE